MCCSDFSYYYYFIFISLIACLFQSQVELIRGKASFMSDGVVDVNGKKYFGKHILIAVGG